jgi:serine protease
LQKILLMGRLFLTITTVLSFINFSFSQKDFKEREIILQLLDDHQINEVINDFQYFDGLESGIFMKKVISREMKYYHLVYQNPDIEEYKFLYAIIEHPAVVTGQLNYLLELRKTPNDSLFNLQWQYVNDGSNGGVPDADIDMDLAWDITTGGETINGDEIVIAIVDDGFQVNHPDFGDNLWQNINEIPNNNLDDDNNGFEDDYLGWNAYEDNDDITDNGWGGTHGTQVAGIVGAKGNNKTGVSGINWDVKLMIIAGGGATQSEALSAYAYPYAMRKLYNETDGQKGAYVVGANSSWGKDFGKQSDAPLWCAMYDSMGQAGILNVGATANIDIDVEVDGDLPSRCTSDHLIIVTNMNQSDMKPKNAAYGKTSVDLGAPGKNVYTVDVGSKDYGYFGGTSAASPHVAGAIGLLYAAACDKILDKEKNYPDSVVILMKSFLMQGVDKIAGLESTTVSGGRLNIYNSMVLMDKYCKGISSENKPENPIEIINIFPNPATDFLRLKFYHLTPSNFEISIIDQRGAVVVVNPGINVNGGFYYTYIDVSELKPGMYYLKITDKNNLSFAGKKFIKQ